MRQVTVASGQTLADIAVQEYGTVEALPALAKANGLAMSQNIATGRVLDLPDVVLDKYLQRYAKNNNIKPATK